MRGSSPSGFHPFHGRLSRRIDGSSRLPADGPYLSYHDVLLTKEDVDTLRYNDWLTDNVISFWEEWLEHEHLSKHTDARVVLLRPSMCFLLVQTADPLSLKQALPDLSKADYIFLPITDCDDPTRAEGGSHWSLLAVSVAENMAFHYDSLASANETDAKKVAAKLSTLLGKRLEFHDLEDSQQQDNGSDCGVFVCSNMRTLVLKKILRSAKGEPKNLGTPGPDVNAGRERNEMVKIIDGFRREGIRRQS